MGVMDKFLNAMKLNPDEDDYDDDYDMDDEVVNEKPQRNTNSYRDYDDDDG